MEPAKKDNSGFALPPPQSSPTNPPADSATSASAASTPVTTASLEAPAVNVDGASDTSSRDSIIGGGILLVLFVAFFFARSAYANNLVAKRVPPSKANAAGWWLFIFLASISTGAVLSAINTSKFMTPLVLGPLGLVGVVALILTIMSSRK